MNNPWKEISLSDYEKHMSLDSVMQLQGMNQMMKDQFDAYPVTTAMVLGVAGGNGLEHVDIRKYRKVYGVDINADYLAAVQNRYQNMAGILECLCIDLTGETGKLPPTELLIANLLIEYIGYECFQKIVRQVTPVYVTCIIQINTDEEQWVSDSPYQHAFGLDEIHHQMDEEGLNACMAQMQYRLIKRMETVLPNGKKLVQMDFCGEKIEMRKNNKKMYPTRSEAEELLLDAEKCNPGLWVSHSRVTAHCAEKIAQYSGMDTEKAYVMGLLHDIGRKFGIFHLRHVSEGYKYMMSLGYDDVARICLTHSFNQDKIEAYVGNFDTSEEDTHLIREKLKETEQDDYDRLIQLCDAIAGTDGVMDIIDRMNDVKRRYGSYDPDKWQTNLDLKEYFEKKMGKDLYEAVEKDTYRPQI